MSHRTCSVEGCDKRHYCKAMCRSHYERWREYGRTDKLVPVHSQPCAVADCADVVGMKGARGWCKKHYDRWSRLGSTDLPARDAQLCVVAGCQRSVRRYDRCDGHSQHFRKYGFDKIELQARATDRHCIVCGARDWPMNGRRNACSANCYQLLRTYGGPPPKTAPCVLCGADIDLTARTANGQKKQNSTKFCPTCKRARTLRHKTSVAVLAKRDGTRCGICGDDVDMTLRRPASLFGPSVDHIIPRGQGGSNDPSNVQLAHLYCNFVKNDRTGFTI